MSRGRDAPQRSRAEWVAFAVACVVLAAFVGLVALDLGGGDDTGGVIARPSGAVIERGGVLEVPVEVANAGDAAVADVQVVAELTVDGETIDGDLLVDFLSSGASDDLVFVFPSELRGGELSVRVAGYRRP